MGKLVVIHPDGRHEIVRYEGREAPLEVLQTAVQGYVEHVAVNFEGKVRSAYCDEEASILRSGLPDKRALAGGVVVSTAPKQLSPPATRIAGFAVRGPLAIDCGIERK